MGWHQGWMNGMGGFMFPGFGLITIVILVVVVAWLFLGSRSVRSSGPDSAGVPPRFESPLDIIKRRYASGEISKEEYDRMKNDLQS
jgi:putative membrane protein